MKSIKSQFVISGIVAAVAILGVVCHFIARPILVSLCQEDGVVESLTAIFYIVAFGLFLSANRLHRYRNLWLGAFACLFLLIAMEEISWGQRAFGIDTPDSLAEINVQEETTLHNIEGIHGRVRALALMFVMAVCFVIPTFDWLFERFHELFARLRLPVFPLWAVGIVTISVLLMAVPRLAFDAVVFELDELGEVTLAIGFLMFAWTVYLETETRQGVAIDDRSEIVAT